MHRHMYKTVPNNLQIMKISHNPKPHLQNNAHYRVELHCVSSAVWEMRSGWVCDPHDLPAARSGLSRISSTSPCLAPARSITLIFTYTEGSCKTCELGEVERKLHRRWLLCFLNAQQFTHLLGLFCTAILTRSMTLTYV